MKVTEAYQSLTPLYLWPQPFACETRKVLDFLQEESRLKGAVDCSLSAFALCLQLCHSYIRMYVRIYV